MTLDPDFWWVAGPEFDRLLAGTYAYRATLDPNGRNGEWHVVVTLPHEVEEYEGYGVPVFEGDVERIEWERQHASRSFR